MTEPTAGVPPLEPSQRAFYHDLLRQMILIRRFEERAGEAYAQGQIGGFCHLYIGQEAVAVGTMAALKPEDYIVTAYREHGHILARGADPKAVMAELFGVSTALTIISIEGLAMLLILAAFGSDARPAVTSEDGTEVEEADGKPAEAAGD